MKPVALLQTNVDFVLNSRKLIPDLFFTNQSHKSKQILSGCISNSSSLYIEKIMKQSHAVSSHFYKEKVELNRSIWNSIYTIRTV